MNPIIGAAVIAAVVALVVGLPVSVLTVSASRATAMTALQNTAQATGAENERLHLALTDARRVISKLLSAIDAVIPSLSGETRWQLINTANDAREKMSAL
jgi:tRNA A58 N-methylase Trm61